MGERMSGDAACQGGVIMYIEFEKVVERIWEDGIGAIDFCREQGVDISQLKPDRAERSDVM